MNAAPTTTTNGAAELEELRAEVRRLDQEVRRLTEAVQALQPVQNARILRGYHAASLPRHSHSLPETLLLSKHKVSVGCDLREDEPYWG